MNTITRSRVATAALALALMGGAAIGASPTAAAKSMNINATGGDGTAVDSDGTQGSFTNSVQGTQDSDGIQDAFDMTKSEDVTPQDKAPNKMSK